MPPKSKPSTSTSAPATKSQSKSSAKPPKPVEEQIKRHFNSLCAQIDGGHFKNAIKTCDKILRLAPADKDALDSKLFLLLQTEQYEAALDLIKEISPESFSHSFEKAYILYRLHKEDEASEIVNSARESEDVDSRALLHLEAQIKYRQTDYDAAKEIYNSLLDTCPEDTEEHPDLLTNLNATQAHLDFLSNGYLSALNSLDVSISALEDAGAPSLPSSSSKTPTTAPQATNTDPAVSKPPTKKSRIPKNVILGVTPMPDPERWLKKRERTRVDGGGRGKKGRRKEGMGTGATQGIALPALSSTPAPTAGASSQRGGGKKGKKGR